MQKYKFRAECRVDVFEFLKLVHDELRSYEMIPWERFPDVDFEFETELCLGDIREKLKQIEDGHVMYESVALIDEYTGERYYPLQDYKIITKK